MPDMEWFVNARYGLFIHYGLYSLLGRGEWVMNRESIDVKEYAQLAGQFTAEKFNADELIGRAKKWGMKYAVLTTKHHEGFLLWDSKMSDYNAVKRSPGRDLVREYVDAAREQGLGVGFYYSLMDWRHPDGAACLRNDAARRRFLNYTQGCVRELMSNSGKIDIIWYDVSWPLPTADAWDSVTMNAMARELQPGIIINNRSCLNEDLGTPEEHIKAEQPGRSWEACMTFNGSWGWQQAPAEDWHSTRKVLEMIRTVAAGEGNLLLNIGPLPDGSVPPQAVERLTAVGQWLQRYGDVVYGQVDRFENLVGTGCGNWSRKGNTYYFWASRWPGSELSLGKLRGKLLSARLHGEKTDLPFEQTADGRLVIRGLPAQCPDPVAGVAVIDMVFADQPVRSWQSGYVPAEISTIDPTFMYTSEATPLMAAKGSIRNVKLPPKGAKFTPIQYNKTFDFHDLRPITKEKLDGLAYVRGHIEMPKAGVGNLLYGCDGPIKVWVNGKAVDCHPECTNPGGADKYVVSATWKKGRNELLFAIFTNGGKAYGPTARGSFQGNRMMNASASPVLPRQADIGQCPLPKGVKFEPIPYDNTYRFHHIRFVHRGMQDGLVYIRGTIEAAGGPGILSYDADGPVRVWLNGKPVDSQPVVKPAVAGDRYRAAVTWKKGANQITFAMHTEHGATWGVAAGVEEKL